MSESRTSGPAVGVFGHPDEQIRLITKIAQMYHERGMTQIQIATDLHVSQARVSRLLKRAAEVGVVRTTVMQPQGVHIDLEERLQSTFGLREAVVVDAIGSDDNLTRPLGAAAAAYLEATLTGGDTVGISSWSATLLAAVEAMRPFRVKVVDAVVQVVGGVGDPRVQMQANRLIATFAHSTGADPILMPAPGMLGSAQARDSLMGDSTVTAVMQLWPQLTLALVGIGSLDPSPLLLESGNAVAEEDQQLLRSAGAVGDICLRFFDADGRHLRSTLDERVVGITAQDLLVVPRRVAVAGGERKRAAIRAALRGQWVNVLVTDVATARFLVEGTS